VPPSPALRVRDRLAKKLVVSADKSDKSEAHVNSIIRAALKLVTIGASFEPCDLCTRTGREEVAGTQVRYRCLDQRTCNERVVPTPTLP
jgi:hypothetical protein